MWPSLPIDSKAIEEDPRLSKRMTKNFVHIGVVPPLLLADSLLPLALFVSGGSEGAIGATVGLRGDDDQMSPGCGTCDICMAHGAPYCKGGIGCRAVCIRSVQLSKSAYMCSRA